VGQERGPLSLVSTTEELLGRKTSGSGLENRDYGLKGSIAVTTWHPLSGNVGSIFAKSCGPSVGIVRWRTQATEFLFVVLNLWYKTLFFPSPPNPRQEVYVSLPLSVNIFLTFKGCGPSRVMTSK
jgi:hypothetical protein